MQKKQEKLGFYHDPLGLAKLSLAGAAENMPRLYASLQLAKLASPKDFRVCSTSVFFHEVKSWAPLPGLKTHLK